MKVSSNKDSKRIAWAVSASLALHLAVGAVYVLTPWLRTLLAFTQMNKPSVQLDMGMPQFVDLMIEELKNSKPAEPQKPEEPQKVEEPPKEEPKKDDPPKVAVKPKDPDAIIIPEHPKTKPVSQPTSKPTSLASTQPSTEPTSLASTEPASKPSKAGGVPLVATGMVDVMPSNSKWLVLLGTAQMRESPEKAVLGDSMRNFVFSDGEPINKIGLDALDDVEEVMLTTPSPWVTKDRFAFVIRLRESQEKTKKKMEETAAKAGTKLISAKMNGHEIWQWESEAKLGATGHYAFAFLSQDVMVIGVPATLQQFFGPAATSKPTSTPVITKPTSEPVVTAPPKTLDKVMTERGKAPAILFAVSDLGKTLPLKLMIGTDWGGWFGPFRLPPQPLYFRAAFNTVENANASFEAAFLTNQDAIDGATRANALIGPLTLFISKIEPFDLLVPIAKKVKFKVYGTKMRADIDITHDEVAILLEGFAPIIKGEAPPEKDLDEKEPKPGSEGQAPLAPKPASMPSLPITPQPSQPIPPPL